MEAFSFLLAVWTGLEPATPCVTGRYSKPTELPDRVQKKYKYIGKKYLYVYNNKKN